MNLPPTTYHLPTNLGFTLLEVLLSVAIISVLAGLSLPVYRTLIQKNDLDVSTITIVQSLRRAQTLAQAVDGDTTWGVKIQSGSTVLFKGTSFAARDSTYDETFDLSQNITPSGTTEYVFAKFTGLPQSSGTVTLTTEGAARSVVINGKGMISY